MAGDVERLAGILRDPNVRQSDREEAAARLVSRQSGPADAVLQDVLVNGSRDARLAAARALAADRFPNEALIEPLAGLLRAEPKFPSLAEAAGRALAAYRRHRVAMNHLVEFSRDSNQPADARARVIRALGRVVDPGAAEVLVGLLSTRAEPRLVRDAAGDALVDMTGLRENGRDVRRWDQWLQQNADKTTDRWRADVLEGAAARLDRIRGRHERLVGTLDDRLFGQYRDAPREKRADVLLGFLNSAEPDERAIGAGIVTRAVQAQEEVNDAIRNRLVDLVGDSDPTVRRVVAQAIRDLNHREALAALLTQLEQEREPDVRIAIAGALAPIGDPSAVPQLVAMLNVTQNPPDVAAAAAQALGRLARVLRQTDPKTADFVVERMRALVINPQLRSPGGDDVRVAAIDALAALQDPQLLQTASDLLSEQAGEPLPVRQAALRALRELGNPEANAPLMRVLSDERDASLRLLALDALARTAGFELAGLLLERSGRAEIDELVRDRAWATYLAVLQKGTEQELVKEVKRHAEPERQIEVLRVLCAKLEKSGQVRDLAYQRQNLGAALLKLAQPRPAEAARYFHQALDYWLKSNDPDRAAAVEVLTGLELKAWLQAREYTAAMRFSEETIKRDPTQQDTVGPIIKNEADALREKKQFENATALIKEALAMSPPLEQRHMGDLKRIQSEINATANGNGGPPQ